MGAEIIVIIVLANLFGFYMAWGIGANDVANAMGTSVGSGALTLKRAVILAAVLEFAGAFLAGSHVSETVRKGIVDPAIFAGDATGFMLGMLAALLAAGAWLQVASYFGWPVSTTHSIVGAVVGFGAAYGGMAAVHWGKVGTIVASWVVSPLLSGILSYFIFRLVLKQIFYTRNPVHAAKRFAPWMAFVVFFVLTLATVFKGLKNLKLDLDFPMALLIAALVGLVGALITGFLIRKFVDEEGLEPVEYDPALAKSLSRAAKHLRRVEASAQGPMKSEINSMLSDVHRMTLEAREKYQFMTDNPQYQKVERLFVYLQILSACAVAFAHGANDVANAIGPMSAVISVARAGGDVVAAKSPVPLWVLALGGVGIVIGLATWGWRVMETIGKKITMLTPSRGFCAEFGAATTIVIASKLSLPISTTHTLVGAVMGVGLARGLSGLNFTMVRDIGISWVVTIPAGAGLAILFFYGLQLFF